jgi:hypothetical protein
MGIYALQLHYLEILVHIPGIRSLFQPAPLWVACSGVFSVRQQAFPFNAFKNCHDFLLQEQRSVLCKEVGRTTKSDKPAFPATMLDIVFHVFVFRFFEQVFSPPTHLVFLFFETPLRLVPLEIRSS